MLLAAAAASATLLSTSGTFFVSPTTFLFLFATSPVDLGEKKIVESFFAGANVAKTFEQTRVMTVLKIVKKQKLVKNM